MDNRQRELSDYRLNQAEERSIRTAGWFYFPQWCGSQHGDLKKATGRFRGFPDILLAVFAYGNLD